MRKRTIVAFSANKGGFKPPRRSDAAVEAPVVTEKSSEKKKRGRSSQEESLSSQRRGSKARRRSGDPPSQRDPDESKATSVNPTPEHKKNSNTTSPHNTSPMHTSLKRKRGTVAEREVFYPPPASLREEEVPPPALFAMDHVPPHIIEQAAPAQEVVLPPFDPAAIDPYLNPDHYDEVLGHPPDTEVTSPKCDTVLFQEEEEADLRREAEEDMRLSEDNNVVLSLSNNPHLYNSARPSMLLSSQRSDGGALETSSGLFLSQNNINTAVQDQTTTNNNTNNENVMLPSQRDQVLPLSVEVSVAPTVLDSVAEMPLNRPIIHATIPQSFPTMSETAENSNSNSLTESAVMFSVLPSATPATSKRTTFKFFSVAEVKAQATAVGQPPVAPAAPEASPPASTHTTAYNSGESIQTLIDLDSAVLQYYLTSHRITSLYPWQAEVLERLKGSRSLLYSMPTSGGKTLVAELSLLQCTVTRQRSGLFVLPFITLAEEKSRSLSPLGELLKFRVDGHYGSSGVFPLAAQPALFVCTIEKANNVLNNLIEEGRSGELGLVVVDELHMVGESHRGPILELFLSKLLVLSDKRRQRGEEPIQIIGMSATIPNLPVLARWLQADCYVGTFRPIKLHPYCVIEGAVLDPSGTPVRTLHTRDATQSLLELVEEESSSILVFCSSRRQSVDTARLIAQGRHKLWGGRPPLSAAIEGLLADLEGTAHQDTVTMSDMIPYGVAYHHGGLLAEEREYIEGAFRRKEIQVLCCTSTLAAGVNLPARRVIFKTPYVGIEFLTKSRYLQMCGRAGRAGLDPYGESFLLLSRRDRERGLELMRREVERCCSKVLEEHLQLERFLLECLGVRLFESRREVLQLWPAALLCSYCSCEAHPAITAIAHESHPSEKISEEGTPPALVTATPELHLDETGVPADLFTTLIDGAIEQLSKSVFIKVDRPQPSPASQEDEVRDSTEADLLLTATPFGISSVRSCLSIREALHLREELEQLRHTGLILADDLHLCYFLTPIREVTDCDWGIYLRLMSRLSDTRQVIAGLVGVEEHLIQQRAMGLPAQHWKGKEEADRQVFIALRFYVALMLADVLSEVPPAEVELKYGVSRGQVQSLMKSAAIFSNSMVGFCRAMEWYSLESVLSSFVKRLGFGVKPDLLPLMEIRGCTAPRARLLWNAGYRSPEAVGAADPQEMVNKVKETSSVDNKAARFFNLRTANYTVKEAQLLLESQIKEKRAELGRMAPTGTTTGGSSGFVTS